MNEEMMKMELTDEQIDLLMTRLARPMFIWRMAQPGITGKHFRHTSNDEPRPENPTRKAVAYAQAREVLATFFPTVEVDWWDDHQNIALTARFMSAQGHTEEDILYMIEKPWKHDDDYNLAKAEADLPSDLNPLS